MTVTPAHLARHYQGTSGQRDPAFLDIAQDHALKILHDDRIFEHGIVFKGGTALRKFRAGNDGRFSTDLDFAAHDTALASRIFTALDGRETFGFSFTVKITEVGRRATLSVRNDTLGAPPQIPAQIEVSTRPIWLPAEILSPIPIAIHREYGFALPATPVMRLEEMIAEKLARYRRHPVIRDLYDLAWCAKRTFDEPLVRRLTVLKVWHDVLIEGRGAAPFDPTVIVRARASNEFEAEAIGYLTKPVDIVAWLAAVSDRYRFVIDLTLEERQVARCIFRDRELVEKMIAELRTQVLS